MNKNCTIYIPIMQHKCIQFTSLVISKTPSCIFLYISFAVFMNAYTHRMIYLEKKVLKRRQKERKQKKNKESREE